MTVNTANSSNGEPVVVLEIASQGTVLSLTSAMELGQALLQAVANSDAKTDEEMASMHNAQKIILPSNEIRKIQ